MGCHARSDDETVTEVVALEGEVESGSHTQPLQSDIVRGAMGNL